MTAGVLKPVEFTRRNDQRRASFHLKSLVSVPAWTRLRPSSSTSTPALNDVAARTFKR
ncbi:hypothetical protein FHX58_006279 [Paraburkholderia tropica]|nr:hypothetical protein [Paraburkholderia tropica]